MGWVAGAAFLVEPGKMRNFVFPMNTETGTIVFSPGAGGVSEYHQLIRVADPSLSYARQLEEVLAACTRASEGRTVHFRRFFLSDGANQAPQLETALAALPSVPTSIVQQAPLDGTRIALWLYCTSPMDSSCGVPSHNGYSHCWSGSMTWAGPDSRAQMEGIFEQYGEALLEEGLAMASDTIRTWIFVRDVDTNYGGVVIGRRHYFDRIGLTPSTHYIASTGIEGRHPDARYLVEMDAYSVKGLRPGQIRFLYARDHLSPTYDYGVTFERGAAVTYGDRRHVFISGTASIDAAGQVMHVGDVAAQTGRMLENISALLTEAGAGLGDLAMGIVYLRDAADYPIVKPIVSDACPHLRPLYVLAPVCRPSWLVEMECLAVTGDGDPSFPAF